MTLFKKNSQTWKSFYESYLILFFIFFSSSAFAIEKKKYSPPPLCNEFLIATDQFYEGGYGNVTKFYYAISGNYVAIKTARNPEENEFIKHEIKMLKRINKDGRSPYVQSIIQNDVDKKGNARLITEWINGGDLNTFGEILAQTPAAEFSKAFKYSLKVIRETLMGLKFIHAHGILHLDIKKNNIVGDLKNGFKIIDFGSASKRIGKTSHYEKPRTVHPLSPEEQKTAYNGGKNQIGPKTDIFSLGVALEIVKNLWLIEGLSNSQVDWIRRLQDTLLLKMKNKNISERPDTKQCLKILDNIENDFREQKK